MTWWLGALAAFAEDLVSILSTHVRGGSESPIIPSTSSLLEYCTLEWRTDTHVRKTLPYIQKF